MAALNRVKVNRDMSGKIIRQIIERVSHRVGGEEPIPFNLKNLIGRYKGDTKVDKEEIIGIINQYFPKQNLVLPENLEITWMGQRGSLIKRLTKFWSSQGIDKLDQYMINSMGAALERLFRHEQQIFFEIRPGPFNWQGGYGHPGGSCWWSGMTSDFHKAGGYVSLFYKDDSFNKKNGIGRLWMFEPKRKADEEPFVVVFNGYLEGDSGGYITEKLARSLAKTLGLQCMIYPIYGDILSINENGYALSQEPLKKTNKSLKIL
jgi:hypothetical protein